VESVYISSLSSIIMWFLSLKYVEVVANRLTSCVVYSVDNRYIGDQRRPINEAVLLELDAATGQLLRQWAQHVYVVCLTMLSIPL